MSDVGVVNTSRYRISEASEKSALNPKQYEKGHWAEDADWSALMHAKAALQIAGGRGKGGGKGKHAPGLKRVRRVLIDAVHGIARAAIN